jgi:hypothetical protein
MDYTPKHPMENDKDWSSRWTKKKLEFAWWFWVLVAVVVFAMAGLAWLQFFPPASP